MAGLDNTGFTPLSLSEVQDDLQAKLQQAFGGTTVDFSSQAAWGQLTGIIANANADLWALGSALYANSYPAGATGVGVDNILAVNNMQRLAAKPTVTNSAAATDATGITRYGLVFYGTPGTVVPAGTLISNGSTTPATFSVDQTATVGAPSQGLQVIVFTNVPDSGAWSATFTGPAGDALTTGNIPYNALPTISRLRYATAPNATGSTWQLSLDAQKTGNIPNQPAASDIQAAITALQGYGQVTVTGTSASGFFIQWPAGYVPALSVTGTNGPDTVVQAIAAYVHGLKDASGVKRFTDVGVSGTAQQLQVAFGAFAPLTSQPNTAAAPIPTIQIVSSTLYQGTSPTSVYAQTKVQGNASQAISTATCTTTGPVAILAGQLNTLVNPISGISRVTNQLDCITGRDVESDAQAIARLRAQQGSAASGSLAALVKRVQAVAGVTQCVGSQNSSNAAQQVLVFGSQPAQGGYSLVIGNQSTPTLSYNTTAAQLQSAVRALPGLGGVSVSVYGVTGFQIDFGGLSGKQAQPLIQVASNTMSVALTAFFGRPAHSVELVVQGGDDTAIAEAILEAIPAGIGTYSNPTARTLATITATSTQMVLASTNGISVGQSVEAAGVPLGTTVLSIANNAITMSLPATATGSSVPVAFDHAILLADAAGNGVSIGFSRAVPSIIYIQLNLKTDLYLEPGNPSSGRNAASQFSLDSVAAIQDGLIALINAVPIGGTIVANGSNSLGGSFRNTVGVLDYDLFFDRISPPTNASNLSLASNEAALAESFSISIDVK